MPENPTVRNPATRRAETSRAGKQGAIVVPARMRRRFGIEEGSLVIAEERDATHLLTGDRTHFGPYYGRTIAGVLILPPSIYLQG